MRGVYIHIPFCNGICSYCDFCKFLYKESWANKYLDELYKEVNQIYEKDTVKTIYIGGGSPSSLSLPCLEKLFNIIKLFNIKEINEITFECNVDDINETLLKILKNNKVNRLSIGVQSFNKYKLAFLNRKHNKKEIKSKIELCKSYGFDNINVDVMYGLSIEKISDLKGDIKEFLKLNVEHISTYSLIIEDHTYIKYKGFKNISEEDEYKMYKYICKKLSKKGYHHYEVSNFSLNGYESVHNQIYWNNEEYYGFGLGAHGYINSIRYENTRNYNKYINGEYKLNELLVSKQEEMENEIMLGLRKLDGISVNNFKNKFDRDIFETFKIKEAIDKDLIEYDGEFIKIPESKIYVMNEIINMIM